MPLQESLFDDLNRTPEIPLLGEQKDIQYYASNPRSILNGPASTGMGFWSINPYVGCAFGCAYCYARYAHRYKAERITAQMDNPDERPADLDVLPPWLAFERRIFVKREAGEIVRRELRRPAKHDALQRERIVIGTATDPYQPAERKFRVTRGVLEVLAEQRGLHITIITKSPLVTRDADLLARIHERSELSVHISLITVDRELARRLEPRAPTLEARLRAITRLRALDIEVGVNCMPVLPGITDAPEQIEAVVEAVAKARASYLGACALRLQSTARQRYLPFIEAEFPELAARYRSTYARADHVGERYADGLRQRFRLVCDKHGVVFARYYRTEEKDSAEDEVNVWPAIGASAPQTQLGLAL
jgi:DNA repair photolyase